MNATIKRYSEKTEQNIRSRSSGQNNFSGLFTEREREIIRMIVDSKSASQIAEELNISKNTVDTHRKNILEKAGLHKTTELIVFAIENGLR